MFTITRKALVIMAPMAIIAAAVPASAVTLTNEGLPPMDPVMAWAEQLSPRNEFYLNNSRDVELVRYKRVHDIELCAARPDPTAIGDARNGYPLMASWDQDTAVITPGNCLNFEAQSVKVRPAGTVPQNVVLTGTVRVVR